MTDIAEKIINRLRDRLHKKSEVITQDSSVAITPAETAAILEQLQATWSDSEADKRTLHIFIDEWVESHQ